MASEAEMWLVRHGETEWSRERRHTSHTDLDLTPAGAADAGRLSGQLLRTPFDLILTSPRKRARRTAELSGFGDAHVDEDLAEWSYGEYEGITTQEIRRQVPDWSVWTHETPGGEAADQVGERLDRVVAKVRAAGGRALVFGHSHALRALAARWIGQPADAGRYLVLDSATISVLGYERETPVILRWNC
jgi:probable phosphoglycerate mutase